MELGDVLAFIGSASYPDLGRLVNALDKRRATTPLSKPSAAEVRERFPKGTAIELFSLANATLNGLRVVVDEPDGVNVRVTLGGTQVPIPAACAAPLLPGEAVDAAPKMPPMISDRVKVGDRGPNAGREGVVIGASKTGRLTVVLDGGVVLGGGAQAFERLPKPEKNPNLVVTFKDETGTEGQVYLYDRSVGGDRPQMVPFGEPIPGATNFGWLKRKEAAAIARCYGCEVREV